MKQQVTNNTQVGTIRRLAMGCGTLRMRVLSLILVAPLLLMGLAGLTGCDSIDDPTTKTLKVLNDAIRALTTTSEDWQQVLQDAQAQLTESVQSTIRNEIANTMNRGVQAISSEFRCDVDFMRARVGEDVVRIKQRFLKRPVDPLVPTVCQSVPQVIDMGPHGPATSYITLDGYNFNTSPPVQAVLYDGGQQKDVSASLSMTSYYGLVLNISSNGVPLTASSEKVEVRWQGSPTPLSDIPVIHTIPTCQTQNVPFTPTSYTYIPPHTRGDTDYADAPVNVTVDVLPSYGPYAAMVFVDAAFTESEADWTTAAGDTSYTMYSPPPGWKIQYISDLQKSFANYTHTDDHLTDVLYPGTGWVASFTLNGFEGDPAAGSTAKVQIDFKELHIQLIQTANCR